MPITGLVSTLVIDTTKTTDTEIQSWIQGLTITHVYGFSVIPISNTQARLIIIYD